MPKSSKKIIVSKHYTAEINPAANNLIPVYYVEAKPHGHWLRVGGPFVNEDDANEFARNYSISHPNVEAQVVLLQ